MTEERRPGAAKEWFEAAVIAVLTAEAVLDDDSAWWVRALFGLLGLWALAGLVRATAWRLRTRARAHA